MNKKIYFGLEKFLFSNKGTGDNLMILGTHIYGVKEENPALASLGGDTPSTSRSYIRWLAAQRGRKGEHANKLALYLKQLLGIAVTHTDEDRVHIAGPKRNGRECVVRGVESWRRWRWRSEGGEGGRAVEGNKRVPRRTRHFEFPARDPPGGPRGRRVLYLVNPWISGSFERC